MTAAVIRAQNLTKEYFVSRQKATTFKELVVKNLTVKTEKTAFRALDDVSFEVLPGRSLAIIGNNGSGKSTLLKLISGIIQPSSGSIEVMGKVAALLELGAAFQEEFTGMENIFLQCSIFGLSRAQILERLDDILDFSGLHRFIHMPVKRYSSGMFVRLAFAIALHVDAPILVLDEVLAVGDTAFQAKCRDRIERAKGEGRTLLFVSHVPEQVESLADEVLWLEKGRIVDYGPAHRLLPAYYRSNQSDDRARQGLQIDSRVPHGAPTGDFDATRARIESMEFVDERGEPRNSYQIHEVMVMRVRVRVYEPLPRLQFLTAFGTIDSLRASLFNTGEALMNAEPGVYTIEGRISDLHLRPGLYLVTGMLADSDGPDHTHDYQLRMHALSLYKGDGANQPWERGKGRLLPWGNYVSITA